MGLASNLAKLVSKISSGGLLSLSGLENTGADGQVLTRSGGAWSPQALPAGGVTSLNGQTGAITNTNYGSIGSTFLHTGNSTGFTNGSTVAGSSLEYYTTGNTITNAGLSGTWRVMGGKTAGANATGFGTLCMRIS